MKILIADDDINFLTSIKLRLESKGYEIIGTADNSDDIIELAKSSIADIILMDYQMPGQVNGLEAAIRIYEEYDLPSVLISTEIPVIPSQPSQFLNDFTYFRKSDDIDFLDFTLKQSKSLFDTRKYKDEQLNNFRELINSSPYGLLVIDKDGKVSDANKGASKIFDLPKDKLMEMNIKELVILTEEVSSPKPGLSWYLSLMKSKVKRQNYFTANNFDGKSITIEVNASPCELGDEKFFTVHFHKA